MNQASSRVITVAFSCALALLSGVIIASYLSVRQSNQDKQWVIHSYNVITTIKDMNIRLLSAESKRRGYIVVGKPSYIETYQQDQDKVYKSLNKLYNLTKDNSKQQRRLNEIKPLIDKIFIFFDKSIKLFSQNPKYLSSQIAITEENSRLNELIETISKEMEGEEKILLKLRTQQTSSSISRTNILVGVGYGFSLVLLVSVYLLLRKQFDLIYPTDKEILKTVFEAHLTRQTSYYSSEYRMRCKDCSYKWVLARGQALWNEAGIPIRTVGSITDITERKQAEAAIFQFKQELETRVRQRTAALQISEAELQKLNKELLRSNEDLEQFAYIVSHDLQEPLRAIIGFTHILEAKYQEYLDESAQRYIKIIIDAGERMHQLIYDLLTYSRVGIRGQEFTVIDSNQALNQAMINLQVAIAESQAIINHDTLPKVLGDKTQLVQVFQNIIANAIKFCRQKPQIHIGVKEIENPLYTQKYLFWIQDNGIGIKSQYIKYIFDVFRRLHTRDDFSGTGIGLAICKKIIERHNGNIWAESEPEVGTTFYFTLTAPSESLLVNRVHN